MNVKRIKRISAITSIAALALVGGASLIPSAGAATPVKFPVPVSIPGIRYIPVPITTQPGPTSALVIAAHANPVYAS